MREERLPGELQDPSSSSLRIGLKVAGVVAGLALLSCGGVAGFVAWKDGPPDDDSNLSAGVPVERLTKPETVRAIARKIVDIEIPTDYEPILGDESGRGRMVAFGRSTGDGALLKLSQVDLPEMPPGAPSRTSDPMLLQMTDRGSDLTTTVFTEMTDPSVATRELTIIGNRASFQFLKGKRVPGEKTLRKVGGTFSVEKHLVALIYTIPEEEYDEASVVRMIESIRAPEGGHTDKSEQSTSLPVSTHSTNRKYSEGERLGPTDRE